MQLIRFFCGCNTWNRPCYQRGNNHYIAVPEEEGENAFFLDVSEIIQKGKKIWLGGKQAHQLDFLSHVPQVEDHLDQNVFSQSLYLKENYSNYQRRLDVPRVQGYGDWWSEKGNSSVNAVVLAVTNTLDIHQEQGDRTKMWMEDLHDNFKRIHIPTNWLDNNCPACGTVPNQLNSIISNPESSQLEIESAQSALSELTAWAHAEVWRDTTLAKTFYCLNRHCPRLGDHEDEAAYHHYKGLAEGGLSVKPFEIIDGQHRIKGSQQGKSLHRSKTGNCLTCMAPIGEDCDESHELEYEEIPACEEPITFSLVSQGGGFEGDFHGKLFTEITTEAKKLKAEHQLYMQWRFEVKARDTADLFLEGLDQMPDSVKRTEGKYNFKDTYPDMAYKLILMLNRFGRTKSRIRPLGEVSTGEAGPLTKYYSGSMKTQWAWAYHTVITYFSELLHDGGESPYTRPRYTASQPDIESMKNLVHLYLDTALEFFNVMDDWSADKNAMGRISGPKQVSGGSEGSSNNAFPYQVIFYLFPHVMKQSAIEKYLQDTPEAEPQDLADTAAARNTTVEKLWKTINPTQITKENIRSALSVLGGVIPGIHDNSGVEYSDMRRGYELADILGQLVVKPLSYDQNSNPVAVEIRDLEAYE